MLFTYKQIMSATICADATFNFHNRSGGCTGDGKWSLKSNCYTKLFINRTYYESLFNYLIIFIQRGRLDRKTLSKDGSNFVKFKIVG